MVGTTVTYPNVGFVFKVGFSEYGGRCRTEYSKGTAVARERFGILGGYYRGDGNVHV
jgi:hypothetical protein